MKADLLITEVDTFSEEGVIQLANIVEPGWFDGPRTRLPRVFKGLRKVGEGWSVRPIGATLSQDEEFLGLVAKGEIEGALQLAFLLGFEVERVYNKGELVEELR